MNDLRTSFSAWDFDSAPLTDTGITGPASSWVEGSIVMREAGSTKKLVNFMALPPKVRLLIYEHAINADGNVISITGISWDDLYGQAPRAGRYRPLEQCFRQPTRYPLLRPGYYEPWFAHCSGSLCRAAYMAHRMQCDGGHALLDLNDPASTEAAVQGWNGLALFALARVNRVIRREIIGERHKYRNLELFVSYPHGLRALATKFCLLALQAVKIHVSGFWTVLGDTALDLGNQYDPNLTIGPYHITSLQRERQADFDWLIHTALDLESCPQRPDLEFRIAVPSHSADRMIGSPNGPEGYILPSLAGPALLKDASFSPIWLTRRFRECDFPTSIGIFRTRKEHGLPTGGNDAGMMRITSHRQWKMSTVNEQLGIALTDLRQRDLRIRRPDLFALSLRLDGKEVGDYEWLIDSVPRDFPRGNG